MKLFHYVMGVALSVGFAGPLVSAPNPYDTGPSDKFIIKERCLELKLGDAPVERAVEKYKNRRKGSYNYEGGLEINGILWRIHVAPALDNYLPAPGSPDSLTRAQGWVCQYRYHTKDDFLAIDFMAPSNIEKLTSDAEAAKKKQEIDADKDALKKELAGLRLRYPSLNKNDFLDALNVSFK